MKVRLTTLTPLHIGGREGALSPLEFVFFGDHCYVVSEEKLATALQKAGKTDLFIGWFSSFREENRQKPSLFGFLREQALLNARFLEQVCTYAIPTSIRVGNNLRPFSRNGFNRPFLPGSAVKGPIRTAFLYKSLKDLTPDLREELLDIPVAHHLKVKDRDKQGFSRELDANFFQRFVLREGGEYDPHTDVFRCLRVTDSAPLSPDATQVEEIKVYSAPSKSPKNYSIYAECLPAGSVVECELSVDEATLAEFKKRNQKTWFETNFSVLEKMLNDPLKVWAEMGQDLWNREDKFFSRELRLSNVVMPQNEGQPMVRLGWGGGLLGTSVDMLLPDSMLQDLRNTLFKPSGNTPAPKSRRLAIQNDNQGDTKRIPLGWATVERVA